MFELLVYLINFYLQKHFYIYNDYVKIEEIFIQHLDKIHALTL